MGGVSSQVWSEEGESAKIEFFRKKVAPVLKEHCFECHSKKSDEVKGDLLLDSQAALAKGGANGPAVVPGDIEASFLIRTVRYTEDDYKMPPRGKLDDDVVREVEGGLPQGHLNEWARGKERRGKALRTPFKPNPITPSLLPPHLPHRITAPRSPGCRAAS